MFVASTKSVKRPITSGKTKYGGMDADIRRLRELEEENGRLKALYAELSLEHRILKEVLTKKL
jgi:putative transposase